ncbi:MAG TPA: hypothetical protein VG244_06190 [Acidimicrobiales bacterium]|nr:hypothetical protein [Acidimicrobiales bacterium]
MSPWLITTTGWSWIVGAAIHGSVNGLKRPAEVVTALAITGCALLLAIRLRSRRRSTS